MVRLCYKLSFKIAAVALRSCEVERLKLLYAIEQIGKIPHLYSKQRDNLWVHLTASAWVSEAPALFTVVQNYKEDVNST
jgi:hypothetical protein